jgi:hypothetical protein
MNTKEERGKKVGCGMKDGFLRRREAWKSRK